VEHQVKLAAALKGAKAADLQVEGKYLQPLFGLNNKTLNRSANICLRCDFLSNQIKFSFQ